MSSPDKRVSVKQATGRSLKLIPPPNFGMVEDGLYRSGQPSELSFPFLEKLRLKSIIWLAPEDPNPQLFVPERGPPTRGSKLTASLPSINFLADQDVKLHHLGVENAVQYDGAITEEVVLSSLALLLVPASLPMLIMCNLGRHRTGTVVGVFRRLQRWNLTSILEEYRRYAGPKVRVLNEQFIELFDCDLVSVPLPP
ncbi:tyrosine-protein phosphatase OCA1, partial [Phenoliferia sp. Uapishka_3]